jgi:hypothetical protein
MLTWQVFLNLHGTVRVDYRFEKSPNEPQYVLYSFKIKDKKWILADVNADASYKPCPSGKVNPRFINETDYSGVELQWIKVINQDVKEIAEENHETFMKPRDSEQSIGAQLPKVPYASVELIDLKP